MLGNLSVALMILNSTNQYLLKIQVTVIPNFKNKEQLSAMLNARKGKSMEAIMQSTYNIYRALIPNGPKALNIIKITTKS